MQNAPSTSNRPRLVLLFSILLLISAVIMALLGWSAHAYYVPAICLLIQAALLWKGQAFALFKWVILINQISGIILILVLWLGEGLGSIKLDISAVMLLVNLLCGGPLMAVFAAFLMPSMKHGKYLFEWFNPQASH